MGPDSKSRWRKNSVAGQAPSTQRDRSANSLDTISERSWHSFSRYFLNSTLSSLSSVWRCRCTRLPRSTANDMPTIRANCSRTQLETYAQTPNYFGLFFVGWALITVWLEVRVLPGPPATSKSYPDSVNPRASAAPVTAPRMIFVRLPFVSSLLGRSDAKGSKEN